MTAALRVLCCRNFLPELEAAVAAETWRDVTVAAFEPRCGRPPLTWDELRPLAGGSRGDAVVIGGACLQGLGPPPPGGPVVRECRMAQCLELVADPAQVEEALARNAYLVTPGWLAAWRERLRALGLDDASAAALFHEFARELLLLDTGASPDARGELAELAAAVALPARRVVVGLGRARLQLARLVTEWRLEAERRGPAGAGARAQEHANLMAAMDFIGRLVLLTDERQVVAATEELFRMLFAPRRLHYVRVEGGVRRDEALPPELRDELAALGGEWAWTASGSGLLLRVAFAGETLGAVVLDGLAFPESRERYLALARSLAGASGLAIRNARTYRRLEQAQAALRRSERALRLAQEIAHVGHWEWDVHAGQVTWSDETFRIFGFAPGAIAPTAETFLQLVHPDDRATLEAQLAAARAGGRFELEYRIVPAGGGLRVVRGMGEAVRLDPDRAPRVVGTVQRLEPRGPADLLGVVQDVTDRKELEHRLEHEARTDALTGCANRRAFLQRGVQELARVRRYGGELAVLMLDLDRFKAINDRHGHAAGDAALRELARVSRATVREQDVIGRLGGEEFAVLLPETGRQAALEAGERLRHAIAAAEVPVGDGPPVRFTTSIGVAALEPDDRGFDGLMERADRALYEAKSAGRDRVMAVAPRGK